jgi:hypothetical protein
MVSGQGEEKRAENMGEEWASVRYKKKRHVIKREEEGMADKA